MADSVLVDPLGRILRLDEATWTRHIIKGHPDVSRYRTLVEAAVQTPEEFRFSRSSEDCRLYYGEGPRKGLWLCVVGDTVAGIVKTVYLTRRPVGDIEWPS
jgi:hypothetical protein